MSNEETKKSGWGKVAAWTILVLLLLGAGTSYGIYFWGNLRLEKETRRLVSDHAKGVGESVAILSRDYLERGDTAALQDRVDEIVRRAGVQSLTVIDASLHAVVATDRKDLGARLSGDAVEKGVTAQGPLYGEDTHFLPVMASTKRLATLRVVFDPSGGDSSTDNH